MPAAMLEDYRFRIFFTVLTILSSGMGIQEATYVIQSSQLPNAKGGAMSAERRLALVTGATMARGIGRATALTLAREGCDVVVTGFNNMDGAKAVSDEIKAMGRRSLALKMNGRDYSDVQRTFAAIKQELGPVEVLVNNVAQMRRMMTIAKTTIDDWENEVKLCLNSAFYCIKEAWDDMCANKWGRIVNMTSVAGVMGGYGQSSYGSAKAGLVGLAKCVALEGARFNITANCVLVGMAQTEAYDEPIGEEVRKNIEKKIAFRRAASPQEVADAIAYVVSEKARYMTGSIVDLMGGLDLFII
jgi:3-oxoacyl-[acyl-carrier protein] reductase